jgi:20S proteasome alpha/beta subunit
MKKLIISAFLFLPSFLVAQVQSNYIMPRGTLIFGMICTDGIVLASDSRGMFVDTINGKEVVIAYFDKNRKIFDIGGFKIAKAGKSAVGNYLQGYVFKEFDKSNHSHKSLDSIFNDYVQFCMDNFCVSKGAVMNYQVYIIAGYKNKIPYLINYMSSRSETQNILSAFTTNHYSILKYLTLPSKDSLTCKIAAASIKSAINRLAEDDFELGIGGEVEVIKITPENKIKKIICFKPVREYKTGWGLDKAILDGKIELKYKSDEYQKMLIDKLKSALKSMPTSKVK